jgi:hypothetical protein
MKHRGAEALGVKLRLDRTGPGSREHSDKVDPRWIDLPNMGRHRSDVENMRTGSNLSQHDIRGITDTATEKTREEIFFWRCVRSRATPSASRRTAKARLLPRLLASMPVVMSGGSRGQRRDEIESGSQEARETAIREGQTRNGYRVRPSFEDLDSGLSEEQLWPTNSNEPPAIPNRDCLIDLYFPL